MNGGGRETEREEGGERNYYTILYVLLPKLLTEFQGSNSLFGGFLCARHLTNAGGMWV